MDGLIMDYQLNVPAILRRAERLFWDKPVISRLPDRSWHRMTYADLVERTRRLGVALRGELGLDPGDRVATLAWNHHEHLETYIAAPCARLVVHTLNLRLHADDLAYIATHAGDRVLVADKILWPLVETFAHRVPFEHVIAVGPGETPEGAADYEELLARQDPDAFAEEDVDERAAAAMCYTSGTTGRPKGVVYSHRAIALHSLASTQAGALGIREDDVVLPVVPMFHANAWGFPFTCALTGSAQVFPGPHLDPESLLDAFVTQGVTVTAGVPTIWLGILQALDAQPERWDLSRVRKMIVGGAAAPRALIDGLERRHGLHVCHAWGMTELCPLGTVSELSSRERGLPGEEQLDYRARQGLPAPFLEIRARGADGLVPWDGTAMGELEVRGAWVASAYHDPQDGADRWTEDGWFCTGDIVTIQPNGYVEIQDRAKDVIKSGGEWISSVALENALMGHPSVAEAAVIGVPDEKWDERPLAAVVLRGDALLTIEELRDFLAPNFARWWLPDRLEIVDEIPKTAVGKFRKTALRERFAPPQPAETAT